MKISFVVPGDPVGYTRMTQRQTKLLRIPDYILKPGPLKVKKRIRKYLDYKNYVCACVLGLRMFRIVDPKRKIFLNVKIYFSNKKHADPENVRKGIQDALFPKDKLVSGSYDFDYDATNPRCEVEIIQ